MTSNDPSNGRINPDLWRRIVVAALAFIIARLTDGGDGLDPSMVLPFAQYLLPPGSGRGTDRPAV
ncbi:hypothetical protein ACH4TX_41685 [Streptomyces sp. NPDC021098]|uniref:hypothetical protein n=1 Tax=unclassified Streptomyces TaxID=2593676 RepID=UPI0037A1B1AB